ncbi:MAG: hypothetical protein QG656_1627, partial [Candidatus Hydrogenedentes bacterium]|nr:hypothetical protein [Candidatus Hydrogenedentota bacterium]
AARGGNWLIEPLERRARAGMAFIPVCFGTFLLLWLGRSHWAEWANQPGLHNAAWLNPGFLFTRDALALLLFWWTAARFARSRNPRSGENSGIPTFVNSVGPISYRPSSGGSAGMLAFVYCLVFSLLGFDLVMALDPHWFSSLFGAYFFITGLYTAIAAWTFSVLLEKPAVDAAHRKDLAKLIVAFSLLSTYMMFCQLIPIWYENLPEEVRFVIPRLRISPWRWVSLGLLATVYLGPLLLLLPNRAKGSICYLRAIVLLLLTGMWLERWWLVTPTLGGAFAIGLPEAGATAAFLAAFIMSIRRFSRMTREPAP